MVELRIRSKEFDKRMMRVSNKLLGDKVLVLLPYMVLFDTLHIEQKGETPVDYLHLSSDGVKSQIQVAIHYFTKRLVYHSFNHNIEEGMQQTSVVSAIQSQLYWN